MTERKKDGGPIAWMAGHPVAANLLMAALLIGGIMSALRVRQEVFPEFSLDIIGISVPYPGASPEEVERGIITVIEDAVRGLDGVKRVTSTASESRGSVSVEIQLNAVPDRVLQNVKNAVDRITTLPEDAERPTVNLLENRNLVVSLAVAGDFSETVLRETAERIRDELATRDGITLVQLGTSKPLEIAIEIPEASLRAYDLTLDRVAGEIRRAAIDLPAGSLKTDAGEILFRTTERRDFGREFADIPVISRPDGSTLRLGEIAVITDGFADIDLQPNLDGKPAATVEIFRVGDETPISVSDEALAYLAELRPELPGGMAVQVIRDDSTSYRERVELLVRNAAIGLGLVLLMLGLFLEPRLAFWVTLGIPISILGSFLFLSQTNASINMISLFAFIVTLGIIVDDAVVVGENIFEKRSEGMPALEAAIAGARQISGPVTFAVLTNMVAFAPMLFVPGASGKLFMQIPAVAISVFAVSLIESLFVLPAHLSHAPKKTFFWRILSIPSQYFERGLFWFIRTIYAPIASFAVRQRYGTAAVAIAMLTVTIATIASGRLPFTFLPKIDADFVQANVTLPLGVPVERTIAVQERLMASLTKTIDESGGPSIIDNVYGVLGGGVGGFGPVRQAASTGSHRLGIQANLATQDQRSISATEFSRRWRENTGDIAGIETISFKSETGRSSGAAIDVQLSHRDTAVLDAASTVLAERIRGFAGVTDIDSGVSLGKQQFNLELTPEARSLGLTATELARQTRGYFYGVEALRQQRGRNEVRVMVRLPEEERETLNTVEKAMLRTPEGAEIPFSEAAITTEGRAYTSIKRTDGRRVNSVTADLDTEIANGNEVNAVLDAEVLPRLKRQFPGLTWSFEGEQNAQAESLESLTTGFIGALFVIYALLAIPFRSWVQPLVIMAAIPFGIIGAVIGHFVMGFGFSIISIFGIVALSGVVVNDSLVLVVTTNELRRSRPGAGILEIVVAAGCRRFRPILLTSVTTFFGLMPMVLETSMQARFLIPMAISIAFGVMFATFIILLLVPALYVMIEDGTRIGSWILRESDSDRTQTPAASTPRPMPTGKSG
ncbi:MAG: efflux RND transporter permease subunit [Phycisphaera sp. TMED9]|nr:MAG: efflux RND transporter permease subunit [Phycisphaera sp. TMED9]